MKVNLFDFATKELSQDAFLLWLVSNADKHYQEDESLHKVAQRFVRALIGPYKKEIVSIKIEKKQWKHIDLAFSVNNDVFVIIEDKAGACLHGNQLERYQIDAAERAARENRILKCVYFNSKNPVANDVSDVERSKYDRLFRKDFLKILDGYTGSNAILVDYREWLHRIENETEAYRILPITEWTYLAWQGFYEWLRNLIGDCNWNYAANQAGGVWWFQWNVGQIKGGLDFYLQLEYHPRSGVSRLCFKAYRKLGIIPRVASALRAAIVSIRDANGWTEIEHVDSFRTNGTSCTIMCVQMEHFTEGGKIPLNTFHKKLARYERIVDKVQSRVESALQDEKSVKEFLTGDVIQLLQLVSGFEWKVKAGKFALEDFNHGSIRYTPTHGRLPRNFSIQCIFQEPLMIDCQVGGCAANGDIYMPDDSKSWLSKHGKMRHGWSINEDRRWPIWRHVGGDHSITMNHETVVRLMNDRAYRKSIAKEIAMSVLDIFKLVTR